MFSNATTMSWFADDNWEFEGGLVAQLSFWQSEKK